MCGICGLYSPSGEPQETQVDAMRALIRHRGPDQGSTDAFGACVLGHQRLRVVDPEQGYQPVANETGTIVAVFNGELYNFPELREELAARGHEVRGRGDTPVLPHLYEEHGTSFVERLDGMFAIALWDAARRRLVLARDRLGKKPLVWTRLADGTIAFASELKAFRALPGFRAEPDLRALDAYVALQYVPGTRTGVRGTY
jgi:asparagine synthase (glutamine-hydrolysing)